MKKAIAFVLIFATLLITSSCDSAFVDESSVNMSTQKSIFKELRLSMSSHMSGTKNRSLSIC